MMIMKKFFYGMLTDEKVNKIINNIFKKDQNSEKNNKKIKF